MVPDGLLEIWGKSWTNLLFVVRILFNDISEQAECVRLIVISDVAGIAEQFDEIVLLD